MITPAAGIQAVMRQLVAPLAAEIARLGDMTRAQAEEIGALRERVRVYEATQLAERQQGDGRAAPVEEDATAPVSAPKQTPVGRPRPSRWEKARAALVRALS